ncbi:PLDc N-terminal domain-containing protein [Nonlabens antarcticus]|uniref:PLDc N-terminal domain-containing protein n=1 Tax=Nonlabens antarcticus TaxID=392714 RepID=UPI00189112FC|nr:PLD nuclease N-terminal domain-containing protein [Nonlabens antarcticus]
MLPMFSTSLFVFIALAIVGLWIYSIVDIARSRFQNENNRIIYLLVVIFAPLIGVLLYLALWQKEKVREFPRDEFRNHLRR